MPISFIYRIYASIDVCIVWRLENIGFQITAIEKNLQSIIGIISTISHYSLENRQHVFIFCK